MNIDIRLSVGFWQHPKVFRLEKQLGLKGIRSLQILWCWCAQNRPNGNLAGLDVDEIEFVADWRGKKGAFVQACEGNWLDITESGYKLHEWEEYNPYQAAAASRDEARREKARNASNARWHKPSSNNGAPSSDDAQAYANDNSSICSDDAQAYANTMLGQCSSNATSNAQKMPTCTSTSTKYKKENTESIKACAEEQSTSTPPPKEPDKPPADIPLLETQHEKTPDPCVMELPIVGNKKQPMHKVFASDVTAWQELYPGVDVMQQLRNMRGWLDASPKRRKTKSGIRKFITTWLAKEQNNSCNARASPASRSGQPLASTEYQKHMQNRRLMATMLLEHRKNLEIGNAAERPGKETLAFADGNIACLSGISYA